MYDLVVTDDRALLIYLHKNGIVDPFVPVKYPATVADVLGKHVIGRLSHMLSSAALSYTEIPLYLPPEMKGLKLIPKDYERYAGKPVTYRVSKMYTYLNEYRND